MRREVVLIILESGKIEIASLREGALTHVSHFQTNSSQFIRSRWTISDPTKFITSDAQDNLHVWDIGKGITPFYSAQSKVGTVIEIGQFANRPDTVLTLTDKNSIQM